MNQHLVEWIRLDASETVDTLELSQASGLSMAELEELVEYGALVPLSPGGDALLFSATVVVPVRTVARLRLDYDLDLFTAGMLLGYLGRIEGLERQLQSLRAQVRYHHEGEGSKLPG